MFTVDPSDIWAGNYQTKIFCNKMHQNNNKTFFLFFFFLFSCFLSFFLSATKPDHKSHIQITHLCLCSRKHTHIYTSRHVAIFTSHCFTQRNTHVRAHTKTLVNNYWHTITLKNTNSILHINDIGAKHTSVKTLLIPQVKQQ